MNKINKDRAKDKALARSFIYLVMMLIALHLPIVTMPLGRMVISSAALL